MTTQGFVFDFEKKLRGMEYVNLFRESGRVSQVIGPIIEGSLPGAGIGSICAIVQKNKNPVEAEVVGFRNKTAILMPLESPLGIKMGARIELLSDKSNVTTDFDPVGSLINARGEKLLSLSNDVATTALKKQGYDLYSQPLTPAERGSIDQKLTTGVRAIDSCIPLGCGQRIAVMAASGVGKSVLMGMIAQSSKADINVVALIGERGREVTEFIERDLNDEAKKKTVVVAVTSDESPLLKVRGAYLATAIAEHYRDQGKNVFLMIDSVTRFAMALREIGLASGEPPTSKGYTPSVFAHTPRLLERAGLKKGSGSITGLYTVLVEGNDFDDPIADNVRSIVDGHIVLSRELAEKNHFPAVDVLASISRLSQVISTDREKVLSSKLRKVLAVYRDAEDLINIGGYRKGSNAEWDHAIELYPKIISFLQQGLSEGSKVEIFDRLEELFRG